MMEFLIDNSKYLAVLLGLAAGLPLVWKNRDRLQLDRPRQAVLLAGCFSVCSVLSALLFATLEGLMGGKGFHLGAISTYGVYFICPILLLAAAKAAGKSGKSWMDVFALYALPSLFLLRINCLISGCCGGRAIGATGLHWPTRQAEMVFYGVMLLVLLRREKANAPAGTAFPLLMAAYGAFRFIVEWFRTGEGSSLLHLAHGWSILAGIIGLGLYFELNGAKGTAKRTHGERSVSKC